jgi:biotin operon repressor
MGDAGGAQCRGALRASRTPCSPLCLIRGPKETSGDRMAKNETTSELLAFFKALADETRLKIVGVLAREPCSGEQLAAIVGIKPATVTHHVQKLTGAGLLGVEPRGHSRIYHLKMDTIHALAQRLLAEKAEPPADSARVGPRRSVPEGPLAQAANTLDLEAYDRKVLKVFLRRDGSLKEIPAQYKKQQVVLRHLVKAFESERQYTEKQVNDSLAHFHPDTASLRRAMIDTKLMARAHGKYWRR